MMRCERLDIVGMKRGRDRLMKYWKEVIRQNMMHLQIMVKGKTVWRSQIMVEG